MNEGERGHSETKDPVDQLHRNEVIPADANDVILAEEDEDCDDLYNDINVGQVFLQPFLEKKDSRVRSDEAEHKKMPPPPPLSVPNEGSVSLSGAGGIGQRQALGVGSVENYGMVRNVQGVSVGGASTSFILGELLWWTTDAELEFELRKYGQVKDVFFFVDRASGQSKGYCRVKFYDPVAAAACRKGIDGHAFNGKPCKVSSSPAPFIKETKKVEAQNNKNQPDVARPGDGNGGRGGINQGGDGIDRGHGRGNWGKGNDPGMGNRMGGRNAFGEGIGVALRMLHPHPMMRPMGRMGGYAGFPGGPRPPFYGFLPSYPGAGLHGLAPHVNHSFYGRGMPMHGMGMIPSPHMYGPNMEVWPDPDMGGWGGDEHGGGRVAESKEAAFDHPYDEVNYNRADLPNAMRDRPGTSERMFKDDKVPEFERYERREEDLEYDHEERMNRYDIEISRGRSRNSGRAWSQDHDRDRKRGRDRGRDRDMHMEDSDKYADHHRYKDYEAQHGDERERGQSSRSRIKSRLSTHEKEHQSRNDSDYGKKRRFTSE